MKKRFVCTISLLLMACLLLALSACNDGSLLPDKNSTSASPSETQLAQEKLIAIRDRIHQNLRYSKGYDKQDYENLCAAYSAGNPFPDTVTEEQWDYFDLTDYYRVLHEEPDNSRFHSPEMVSQLSSGMLINEVYDILGAPHFVAEAYLMDTSYGESSCYSYSFYVLCDGTILLIQYESVAPENYDSLNFGERIPNFSAIRYRYEGPEFHWRQLSNIEILSEQELLERTFYDRDLLMPLELWKNL